MNKGLMRGLLIAAALAFIGIVALGSRYMFFSGGHHDGLSVGGPFTLTDENGHTVHSSDFRGKLMLVYFGYTFCPDVCPTELTKITAALDQLGPAANAIQPLFITIDPARDTPKVMKDYVSNFYKTFKGLTGTPQQIAAVAHNYHVYYAKIGDPKATQDYSMDHSSFVYLIGRKGQYLGNFAPQVTAKEMANSLREAMVNG